jgi:metallo-beta-lactamase family protein
MMNGGRVLHYLESHLNNPKATVVIPGFQAAGTRGRMISEGTTEIKLHGHYFKVRATVEHIHTMSSHADQSEILDWMSEIKNHPTKVFIVHGEPHAAQVLRVKIKDQFGWDCIVPQLNDMIEFNLA